VWIVLFGGGLEEPGWRGFALLRLQSRWSPLVASVILGLLWASWHDPEYFTSPGMWGGPGAFAGILYRLVWNVPLAIIFTWLYNRSGRSRLLTLIVLHASFNTTTLLVPMSFQAGALLMGTMWAIALVCIVAGRMWRKTQAEVPIVSAPAVLAAK
jgi:membrane protease YdiL (CAAX protease family)